MDEAAAGGILREAERPYPQISQIPQKRLMGAGEFGWNSATQTRPRKPTLAGQAQASLLSATAWREESPRDGMVLEMMR